MKLSVSEFILVTFINGWIVITGYANHQVQNLLDTSHGIVDKISNHGFDWCEWSTIKGLSRLYCIMPGSSLHDFNWSLIIYYAGVNVYISHSTPSCGLEFRFFVTKTHFPFATRLNLFAFIRSNRSVIGDVFCCTFRWYFFSFHAVKVIWNTCC